MPDTVVEVVPRREVEEQGAGLRASPPWQAANDPVSPAKTNKPRSKRPWTRWCLFGLVPLALIAGGYWYVTGGQIMTTDNAYIAADKVGVSTDVSGIVKEVDVTENEHVQAEQVLFRLDDQPFQYALRAAEAQIGLVRNDLSALKANYRDVQEQIKQAQDELDYRQTVFNRRQKLLNGNVIGQEDFDTARRDLLGAQQKMASLNQQLAETIAQLNGDPDIPVEAHPRYMEALAHRDEAARQLDHTIVRAPFAGIVTNVPSITPGRYLGASVVAFYLVDTDHVWIDTNPKETELTFVRPGQEVTVSVDTYPGMEWRGTVESISPAAAQEFSLLPAQNTSGNWVKVVQRIPMRIRVDTTDATLPPLRSGMSVEVNVDTGHVRGIPHFIAALFGIGNDGQ